MTTLGQACSPEDLKLAGIDTCLVKPVKQSRLLECLVAPIRKTPDHSIIPPSVLSVAPARSGPSDSQPEKTRVLLAEDNHTNQLIAVGLLRKLGYSAEIAPNGLAALEALRSIPYDIILMDCQMPEMDGYDAAREIRKQEQGPSHGVEWKSPVYIIAITANAMAGDRAKCLAAGMDDYLTKPIRLKELEAALGLWKAKTQDRCNAANAARVRSWRPGDHTVSPEEGACASQRNGMPKPLLSDSSTS